MHADHLGTPQQFSNQAGTVVWAADYEPFGKISSQRATVLNRLRFPGQVFDGETGLHYNYSRDYAPTIGRYVQSDPIGLAGGINSYNYVGVNPVRYKDRFGLENPLAGFPELGVAPAQVPPREIVTGTLVTLAPYLIVGAAAEAVGATVLGAHELGAGLAAAGLALDPSPRSAAEAVASVVLPGAGRAAAAVGGRFTPEVIEAADFAAGGASMFGLANSLRPTSTESVQCVFPDGAPAAEPDPCDGDPGCIARLKLLERVRLGGRLP